MKTKYIGTVLLLLCWLSVAKSQEDISGIWAGVLAVAPDTNLNVHFVITRQADGSYAAVLTSPDPDGVKDVEVNAVAFESNRLTMSVDALSGTYNGQWMNGEIEGLWEQQGTTFSLRLQPYEEPVLSEEAKAALAGSWVGALELPNGQLAIVFRFETSDAGEFVGFLDSPDQGATDIPIGDIELSEGNLSFRIPQVRGEYSATLSGSEMSGSWTQGQALPLNMRRGEYTPPDTAAGLSNDIKERLEGSWVGVLTTPRGELNVVYRLVTNDDGNFVGFMDSPDQGARDIPISAISFENETLSLTVPAVQGQFTGTIGEAEIAGTWKQGPGETPLTLRRGTYAPSGISLDLSSEDLAQLAGAWTGSLGPLELTIRFEADAAGNPAVFLDVPAQGAADIPITEASLDGGQLSLSVLAIAAQYTATVEGDAMNGQWQQGPGNNPLTLTRQ